MNIQNQINLCINHINNAGEGVSRIEIQESNNAALVWSLVNPCVYFTIWTIYTDEQIYDLELNEVDNQIAEGEKTAAEIAQVTEEEIYGEIDEWQLQRY